MTSITPWLAKAGKYQVEQLRGYPGWNQSVDLSAPRAGVLHTTEGSTAAGALAVFKAKPWGSHFVVGMDVDKKVHIYQIVPVGLIAGALVAHNNLAAVQIEVVGFSKETPWLPNEATLDPLAALMATCQHEYGIPLSRPWVDGDWGKYGDNPHRHSAKFGRVAGWFAHGDVPSPDVHWDPGNLKWDALFARARSMTDVLTAEPEDAGPNEADANSMCPT